MGTCSSCSAADSSSAAAVADGGSSTSLRPSAARVIDLHGSLSEFRAPVTAAQALLASSTPSSSCFLCSSDGLFVDASIPAVVPDEPLRPGQIYFALPVSMLRHPLSLSDMAALATRASSAFSIAKDDNDEASARTLQQQQQRPRRRTFRVRSVAAEVDEATCEVLNENISALAWHAALPAPPPALVKMKKKTRPSPLHVPARCRKNNLITIQELADE